MIIHLHRDTSMTNIIAYTGKIAEINVTSKRIKILNTHDYSEKFIGGRGIAQALYHTYISNFTNALDKGSPLIFMTGPVTATPAFSFGRLVIYGKSPLMNPEQSSIANMGGSPAMELKKAGFDGIVLIGKSEKPCHIEIKNGEIEIVDATELWGKDTRATLDLLEAKYKKKGSAICIGPAGEKEIRFSVIAGPNGSYASRGFGAVMGSKRIKAVSFFGNIKINVAKSQKLKEINLEIQKLKKNTHHMNVIAKGIKFIKRSPCKGCPKGCERANYKHKTTNIIEHRKNCGSAYFYYDYSKNYMNGKFRKDNFFATSLCNKYGLCTQEFDKILLWLKKCFENEIIGQDYFKAPFNELGSIQFLELLIDQILTQDRLGVLLAQGTSRAANKLGTSAIEQTEKIVAKGGYNPTTYNPRYLPIAGLLHATDNYPITQLHELSKPLFKWMMWKFSFGLFSKFSTKFFKKSMRKFWKNEKASDFSTWQEKGATAARIQNRAYARDTLVGCDFFYPVYYSSDKKNPVGDNTFEYRILSAVLGKTITEDDYLTIGERIFNLQRIIWQYEIQASKKTDIIPEFNFTENFEKDRSYFGLFNKKYELPGEGNKRISRKGMKLNKEEYHLMLNDYYKNRKWDTETGLPTKEKIDTLNLTEYLK